MAKFLQEAGGPGKTCEERAVYFLSLIKLQMLHPLSDLHNWVILFKSATLVSTKTAIQTNSTCCKVH